MKRMRTALAAAVAAVILAGPLAAQEGMPPMPKPGPEHAILRQDEGAWTRPWRCSWLRGPRP